MILISNAHTLVKILRALITLTNSYSMTHSRDCTTRLPREHTCPTNVPYGFAELCVRVAGSDVLVRGDEETLLHRGFLVLARADRSWGWVDMDGEGFGFIFNTK